MGRADQPSTEMNIEGYAEPWKTERSGNDKGGGGLVMYFKETLKVHKHEPIVPPEHKYVQNERQWLFITGDGSKCAFLHVYMACQTSRNDSYLHWNEDLFCLLKQEAHVLKRQGFMILAMGDFNSRCGRIEGLEQNTADLNNNSIMFFNFLEETNLLIINSLPIARGLFTRFMYGPDHQRSCSLLDYGLIDQNHSDTVTSFVIDSNARFKAGSDHALLECRIKLSKQSQLSWQFTDSLQYNITSKTNYDSYSLLLDSLISKISVTDFESLSTDQMLAHISDSLNTAAQQTIGFKVKRKIRNRRLPQDIRNEIKRENDLLQEIDHEASIPFIRGFHSSWVFHLLVLLLVLIVSLYVPIPRSSIISNPKATMYD